MKSKTLILLKHLRFLIDLGYLHQRLSQEYRQRKYPHKLLDLVVKERAEFHSAKTINYYLIRSNRQVIKIEAYRFLLRLFCIPLQGSGALYAADKNRQGFYVN